MPDLEERKKQFVTILGTKLDMWVDCDWCHKPLSVRFDRVGYSQPCSDCKNSEKYEKELAQRNAESDKIRAGKGQQDALDAHKVSGVFESKGRNLFVNKKGDVIRDEPYRPLPEGVKDWK